MASSVTLKQLAAELGVSPATVSLALRNDPMVSAKTRKRVMELAKKRDYVSNYLGKALQSRSTRLIGYLQPGVTRSFYNEVMQGAGDAAAQLGFGLLVGWINSDQQNNERQISMMLEKDVDALIISDHGPATSECHERFLKRGKPVVCCTGAARDDLPYVINDDLLGGKIACETLLDYGHRRILISTQHPLRLAGNQMAAMAFPDAELIEYHEVKQAVELCLKDSQISAITAYSDREALDIIYFLKEKSLRIPEDISIIGFNDIPLASRPEFQLTTIAQQRFQLGYSSVELAVDLVKKNQLSAPGIVLPPHLVERKTVAGYRKK